MNAEESWLLDCVEYYRKEYDRMPSVMDIWAWKDAEASVALDKQKGITDEGTWIVG